MISSTDDSSGEVDGGVVELDILTCQQCFFFQSLSRLVIFDRGFLEESPRANDLQRNPSWMFFVANGIGSESLGGGGVSGCINKTSSFHRELLGAGLQVSISIPL